MILLVCYDVCTTDLSGPKRLREVAKECKNHGVRVQYSVFECRLQPAEIVGLRHRLREIVDPEQDSLRIYYISDDDHARTEHFGVRPPLDVAGPLVV